MKFFKNFLSFKAHEISSLEKIEGIIWMISYTSNCLLYHNISLAFSHFSVSYSSFLFFLYFCTIKSVSFSQKSSQKNNDNKSTKKNVFCFSQKIVFIVLKAGSSKLKIFYCYSEV